MIKDDFFKLSIIVSGGIFKEKSNKTLEDIKADGIKILAELPISTNNDNHAYTIGELCLKILPEIESFFPI